MSQLTENLFVLTRLKKREGRTESGEGIVNAPRISPRVVFAPERAQVLPDHGVLDEASFHKMISRERRRTERSRKPFLLMLLDLGDRLPVDKNGKVLDQILSALSLTTRETDITGWYGAQSVVGVMFTELGLDDKSSGLTSSGLTSMVDRVSETLRSNLTAQQFNQISITCHLFPEDWNHEMPVRQSNPTLYPDLSKRDEKRKVFSVLKRVMDVAGSAMALAVFSPLFLLIAAVIKLTSPGPVFFRQNRVGQHGVSFVFLKFRSMHVNNDPTAHKEYVRQLIAGQADRKPATGNSNGVYKMTNDPRITKIGAFLRRTSLDEVPQFINVLKGEMSLVGPRPPIAYEVEAYDIWHRRRVLEAKPGITGLWQVHGRSRVTFDEMVRLDLHYAKTWSPWMDVKILFRTPGAMFGEGAH
jgi:lipopolysaccharide/colanic/teichoic acid biosynthesis glycosyltransferase